ncbi:MAG: cohesin domain-containing protein [Euryarchaeota archaeon]|nr:cohesin domain-containing protein [Euryarchaeota archaeon]
MYIEKRNLKRLGMVAAISIIALIFAAQASATDNDPEVRVCVPDWTITAFDAIIKMEYFEDEGGIKDLEGEFDLSFDTDVVKVVDDPKSVTGMKIKNKVVSIEWEFVEGSDNKKIHVEFIIPDDTDTRTYGEFVKIHFDLVGDTGDTSPLKISDGSLYKDETPLSVKWTDDTVNIESFDVTVNAPEFVSTDTFDADIDITDVVDLESGGFELSFNSSVVNVTAVESGKISGTEIPVEMWCFKEHNTIRVLFNLVGTKGVSGSGTLATITFAVIGEDGDSSVLDVDKYQEEHFVNTETDRLPINWIDATVTINSEAPQALKDTDTTVFVKNLDDDKLTVFLYIDGNYIDDKDVSAGSTKEYSTYKLVEGPHTFKIKWYDHDTKEEHEKIEERSVSGDTDVVVLYTVEHADEDTRISARVYVKNNDDDPVDVFLYIDDTYKECGTIEAGDTCDYEEKGYEFDEEESHTFEIRWIDPDTDIEYEKIARQYIETAESVTMWVDSHTEDDLITTSVLASDSSTSKSRSAPATSVASDTSAGSGTSTSESESSTTALHTGPTSSESDDTSSGSGAGDSQPYQHLYSLVGVVAIVFAMMQIRRV